MLKYWKDLRHLPRPVWVVAASQLVNRAGSMVLSFLVLYLTRERGFSPEHAGFVLFLYGAGSIVSAPIAGRLVLALAALPAREKKAPLGQAHLSTTTRLRLSTAAHADPRFLFFLAGVLPVTIVFFQHISSMPLYIVNTLGMSPRTFGWLFSLNCLIIVVLEIPLNAVTAHWSHRRTLALGALLSGAGFGAMAFARDVWSLAATVVLWTFGEMLFFPASAAYATDIAPDARRGEYSGLYTMAFSLAFAIGPWAGTVVLERAGARVLWGATFLLGTLAAAMFLRLPQALHHGASPDQTLPDAAGPAEI